MRRNGHWRFSPWIPLRGLRASVVKGPAFYALLIVIPVEAEIQNSACVLGSGLDSLFRGNDVKERKSLWI